jgi:hypothetical protein
MSVTLKGNERQYYRRSVMESYVVTRRGNWISERPNGQMALVVKAGWQYMAGYGPKGGAWDDITWLPERYDTRTMAQLDCAWAADAVPPIEEVRMEV